MWRPTTVVLNLSDSIPTLTDPTYCSPGKSLFHYSYFTGLIKNFKEMEQVSTVLLLPTVHISDWLVDPFTSVDRFRILNDFLRSWYRFPNSSLDQIPSICLHIPPLGSKWTPLRTTAVDLHSKTNLCDFWELDTYSHCTICSNIGGSWGNLFWRSVILLTLFFLWRNSISVIKKLSYAW